MSRRVGGESDRQASYLFEGVHCCVIEPSSWWWVVCVARWSRDGSVVSVAGRSVKVHVDELAAEDEEKRRVGRVGRVG